jgi:hypothetical protein
MNTLDIESSLKYIIFVLSILLLFLLYLLVDELHIINAMQSDNHVNELARAAID